MADVTVNYAFGTANLVTIEILVEEGTSGEPKLTAALPCLPRGTYRLNWVLVPGLGISNPQFNEVNGIEIVASSQPPNVTVSNSHRGTDPRFWEADVDNQVQGANAFQYFAHGTVGNNGNGLLLFARDQFDHDPAVAVTPDPPPGG